MVARHGDGFDYELESDQGEQVCEHDFYLEDAAYFVCRRCGAVMFVDRATVEELWRAYRIALAYHTDPRYSLTLLLVDPPAWFWEFEVGDKG